MFICINKAPIRHYHRFDFTGGDLIGGALKGWKRLIGFVWHILAAVDDLDRIIHGLCFAVHCVGHVIVQRGGLADHGKMNLRRAAAFNLLAVDGDLRAVFQRSGAHAHIADFIGQIDNII